MTRTATILAITALSSIATPFVVNATAAKQTSAEIAAPAVVAALPTQAAAPAAASTDESSCTRRVRVVYRGYTDTTGGTCFVENK